MLDDNVVVVPDRDAVIDADALRFGVSVENRGPKRVDVSWVRSLAYPVSTWLQLAVCGRVQGGDFRSLAGPEVYALMGQVESKTVPIPARDSIRVTQSVLLRQLRYFGAPEVTLDWRIKLNDVEHHGEVTVTLPRRETLILAIEFEDVETVRRLLSGGADVMAADEYGRTPLQFALDGGHGHGGFVSQLQEETRTIVGLLLDHHAPLAGALVHAATTKDEKLLALLISRGANVDETDADGNTALHSAFRVMPPRRDILRVLVEHGANLHARNRAGQTPLDRADAETKAYMLGIADDLRTRA
jgi:hypothetical protein